MNPHEILQSFRRNPDGTWTALKSVAIAGNRMDASVVFARGLSFSGIDVAAYLDNLAATYPLSVRS